MNVRHVVLVGLMGSGKSTVGARLATLLDLPFVDSDALLEATTGRTAANLLALAGGEALHRAECAILREALARPEESVIAAAAAVVDDPACRAALRGPGVTVAWLRADAGTLGARFRAGSGGAGAHRPAYGDDPEAFLAAQARRRATRFSACRPIVAANTGLLDPGASAARIVEALRTAGR